MTPRIVSAIQLAGVGVLLAAAIVGKASAEPCNTIFKVGAGYVDSCTLQQRSPYADLPTRTPTPTAPPQPEPVVIVVPAPVVNVKVTINNIAPTPAPWASCYSMWLYLGRCPLPGETFNLPLSEVLQ